MGKTDSHYFVQNVYLSLFLCKFADGSSHGNVTNKI